MLNERLFHALGLPRPDINLGVGSGSHALQTAEVMSRFEPVVDEHRACRVLVVGDVNSTLACSLVAVKKGIPVAHVEAGLRSFDRTMPEEINRILTDQVADFLYTSERAAHENLAREGIGAERIHFTGNVMIDSLLAHKARAVPPGKMLPEHIVRRYGVVTLHRPSNVDEPRALRESLDILRAVADRLPLACALHPRTTARIEAFGLSLKHPNIAVLPPQGYLEMLGLMENAAVVITDSGGMQEETTALGVPCLTMRENTERPVTVEQGTNTLVGRDGDLVLRLVGEVLATGGKRGRIPEFWDGRAAERIAAHLSGAICMRSPTR
jgi:UDP-N-acetylglucosamine 2-epimerase (non-hydrolysing)